MVEEGTDTYVLVEKVLSLEKDRPLNELTIKNNLNMSILCLYLLFITLLCFTLNCAFKDSKLCL